MALKLDQVYQNMMVILSQQDIDIWSKELLNRLRNFYPTKELLNPLKFN